MKTEQIIQLLRKIDGLANIYVLNEEEKRLLAELEEEENHGMHACLTMPITLVLTHDSSFREPAAPIVLQKNGKHTFPPVPFPELQRAISSSPSKKVHDFLIKRLHLNLGEGDATLVIGLRG